MKQVGLLLILLALVLAACSSGGAETSDPVVSEEPVTTIPPATAESFESETTEPAQENDVDEPVVNPDDPTAARERDWKLGNVTDPVVTIIEYGDFQ